MGETAMSTEADRTAAYREAGLWNDERLGWALSRRAAEHPDREFLVIGEDRFTYGEFAAWTETVAGDMVARGVRRNDRVLIQLPNRVEALLFQAAAFRIGAVSVPVVPIYREHEMQHIVADCRPMVVVSIESMGSRRPCAEIDEHLTAAGRHDVVKYSVGQVSGGTDWIAVPDACVVPRDIELPDPLPADACALILYTSGTTSAPKGVRLTGRGFLANSRSESAFMEWTDQEVFLCCAPLSHLAGFVSGFSLPLSVGGRVVVLPKWDAEGAVRLIEEERVTFTNGAPVFLHDLVREYQRRPEIGHRLGVFLSGGATTPAELIREAEAVGISAMRGFGMTETGGGISFAKARDPLSRRAEFDGHVIGLTEFEAVDADRHRVPPGHEGELRVRGPQNFLGYTDDTLTREVVDDDGWFYTGDIGSVDSQGWISVTGRIKDIINRGGEKFSARDIEEAISFDPGVDRVAVVGVPDERFGESVGAFLTLAPGVVWEGPEKILARLEEARLARQKFPTEWFILSDLPTTPSGKVQKHLLLAQRSQVVVMPRNPTKGEVL